MATLLHNQDYRQWRERTPGGRMHGALWSEAEDQERSRAEVERAELFSRTWAFNYGRELAPHEALAAVRAGADGGRPAEVRGFTGTTEEVAVQMRRHNPDLVIRITPEVDHEGRSGWGEQVQLGLPVGMGEHPVDKRIRQLREWGATEDQVAQYLDNWRRYSEMGPLRGVAGPTGD